MVRDSSANNALAPAQLLRFESSGRCLCLTNYLSNISTCFRYPSQKEWQRKEQLYLKIIEYFERDKQWEHAIPLCKELSHVYEKKVFDYEKLSDILRKEASLFEKVISSSEDGLRLDPEYFRVGFYGKSFPLFLRVSIQVLGACIIKVLRWFVTS